MLTIGIVGLPNVGKSALFNSLTSQQVPSQNFPFCTIDPSVGIAPVKDERLEKLSEISNSKQSIPATVTFKDIAGLIKGASKGQGLGNDFLSHIREADAILHLIRTFDDADVIHMENSADPERDHSTIETELILADIQMIEKHLARLEKLCKQGDKDAIKESNILTQARSFLEKEVPLRKAETSGDEDIQSVYKQAGLLTAKPVVLCFNGEKTDKNISIASQFEQDGETVLITDVRVVDMTYDIISKCYQALNLISFFTTGEKETRAWTIKNGSTAPEAGAAIHTDFKDKFIRAEVIGYDDFISAGSFSNARSKGLARVEGKQYVVKDGDIVLFRI